MLYSMTGYGRGTAGTDGWTATVEAKSVNHRHLDIAIRMAPQYAEWEEPIRRLVTKRLHRGRVEIRVDVEDFSARERNVRVDTALAKGYLRAIQELKVLANSEAPVPLNAMINLPDLFIVETPEISIGTYWPVCHQALEDCLGELLAMRQREGAILEDELVHRSRTIEGIRLRIMDLAPLVVQLYRQRLFHNIAAVNAESIVPEERLATEVALFADRCNIDEELTRLASHLTQFQTTLSAEGTVGRRLDFLLQEMNREVNTIGSKANDSQISHLVVDAKAELEKMREQVQNIE